jgi:type III pantothenate kinase
MVLVFDIGNTNTHVGLAKSGRVVRHANIPTCDWSHGSARAQVRSFARQAPIRGAAVCSVVPRATPFVKRTVQGLWRVPVQELRAATVSGLEIDYPKPVTIGPDRLANALAARHRFGAPVVVVDFGTAVTFDVVGRSGAYVGGIIAPGLAAMTDYLHEKTALLPRIRIREIQTVIGRSTREAMLIGAVHGYRGLVRELIIELKRELKTKRLPVVATGGYGELIAARLPEISAVEPLLTLEGVRLFWDSLSQGAEHSRRTRSQ